MKAAQRGDARIIEMLLTADADVNEQNTSDQTILDLCSDQTMLENKITEIQMKAFRASDCGSVLDQGVTDMIRSYLQQLYA